MIRWSKLSCVVVVLPALSGCGSGTYEPKFDKALTTAKGLAAFTVLGKNPLTIGETPVKIRLPKDLGGVIFDKNSRSPDDSKSAPNPLRLRPDIVVNLPGWVYTIEKRLPDEKTIEWPVSCAIFVIDLAEFKGKQDIGKSIRDSFKTRFPAMTSEIVDCASPTGENLSWEVLRGSGKQKFMRKSTDAERPFMQDEEGQVEFWLHSTPQYLVLLAWRIPTPVAGSFKLEELAKLTAGTIVVGERPAQ